jgi:hypothetical protein
MDIQLLLVIIVFLTAIILFTRRIVLTFMGKKKAGCEKCGITATASEKADTI